jgi:hypothetical protein
VVRDIRQAVLDFISNFCFAINRLVKACVHGSSSQHLTKFVSHGNAWRLISKGKIRASCSKLSNDVIIK